MRKPAAIATLLLFTLCACVGRSDDAVIVAGSTSVHPYAEMLAQSYALLHPQYVIDVQGGGSSAGIMAVESGIAEIGMSSRPLKPSEQGLQTIEIAKDGLAVILHPNNPVSDLTLAQLRGVYKGEITNWKDLGGADAAIHVYAREEGSGTRYAFEEMVMDGIMIMPRAIVQNTNGAVRQLISSDRNAIGFISLGLVDETVKALKLEGVEATWGNVMNGSYRLFRPFLFVTDGQPGQAAEQFIAYTLSPEGQNVLVLEGLIPASEGVES